MPAIRDFAYDEARNELTVTFATGRAYVYSLVPPAVAEAFAAAASQGAFHNAHIRERFPYRKIADARASKVAAGDLRQALAASLGD